MSKFQAGDKVRVINSDEDVYFSNGDVGIVVENSGIDCRVNFNGQNNQKVFDDGYWFVLYENLELVEQPSVNPVPQPSKPSRVRAFKEDYITRAVTAEMRVHQLEVEMNKAVDELADERTAYALIDADNKRLYGVIDDLTKRLSEAIEANRTQLALTDSYKGLYERMTVWQAIKRACGKAGK